MQVLNPNNVKIYNLSAGKSMPEWLSDRKRRALQKNDLDVRRRIELIQDFEMPSFSTTIQATPDEQYIMATGMYKPMVRCYELKQMSMKFERCLENEIIKFSMLSDDFSKMALLQSDRYIEFHSQASKYYRIRIPKSGRDMTYHAPSCDLYVSAIGPEVYRLNLEQGRFLKAIKTDSMEVKCCEFNQVHHLLGLGTAEGQVECWDPRVKKRVGLLDSAINSISEVSDIEGMPAVTALSFQDGLTMGVGMSTGQVLLYDIRSNKPFLVKDHNYGLPIKKVVFHNSSRLVLSQDSRILKIWERDNGKAITSIEPGVVLNDLCVLPNSGLLFMTNEMPKILSYYIPSLGPAPKWCSFLDSLTEEMEENPAPTVYDDYKFVTRTELDGLGLTHLIGSKMLRAYMHGYFLDVRLYHKAKSLTEPFAYDEHRKKKIREKIDEARQSRVQVKKLPKVNRALAEKLLEQDDEKSTSKKQPANLLQDSRFADMFKDSAFQVDRDADEYKLLNPLVTKLEKNRKKKDLEQETIDAQFAEVEEEDEEESEEESEKSSDDDQQWATEVKKQHKLVKKKQSKKRKVESEEEEEEEDAEEEESVVRAPKFMEIKTGSEMRKMDVKSVMKKRNLQKKSLGARLEADSHNDVLSKSRNGLGNMEMTFSLKQEKKRDSKKQDEVRAHQAERKKLRRSAGEILKSRPLHMGKR